MTTFANCPPLCSPRPLYSTKDYKVEIFLDDKLWGGPDLSKLLALCAYTTMMCERSREVRSDTSSLCSEEHKRQIETICSSLPNEVDSIPVALQQLEMSQLFPEIASVWNTGRAPDPPTRQPGLDYLAQVSVLNQLLSMSRQLHNDSQTKTNHKYIAHQIALLYQCLNQTRGETRPFKRRIETMFDKIKGVTESKTQPTLDEPQKRWLKDITADVADLILTCPPTIQEKFTPIYKALGVNS